jgi:uncharacterized membrane protein
MASEKSNSGKIRVLATVVAIAAVVLIAGGAATWLVVRDQLADQKITVAEDADNFAGSRVDGPLQAYAQADVINDHALAASDGLTFAELSQDDPRREVVMTASFLRASLFTSVVAFGVALMAAGLGVVFAIVAWALYAVAKGIDRASRPAAVPDAPAAPEPPSAAA